MKSNYKFHVVQFTWGHNERIAMTKRIAEKLGLEYTSFKILRKPSTTIGSVFTILKGISFLNNYIKSNDIELVMPRSTMPSIMGNRLKSKKFKILFDADGLPIEERVDFANLSPQSRMYKFLKREETKMLKKANRVITRSHKAIQFHLQILGQNHQNKFSVVYNGRDGEFFKPNSKEREQSRNKLGIKEEEYLFVYCGSLGPQYGWDEMISIFTEFLNLYPQSKFLILTGNLDYAYSHLPDQLNKEVIIKSVDFEKVPFYMNAADYAFAIREPKQSMQGVAPIKLGEYLLMGLPVIGSKGIGDSEAILSESSACFIYNHQDPNRVEKAVNFLQRSHKKKQEELRGLGIKYFSLERSAESYLEALDQL
jgi:glycosyltransferase involved in cell wall biosynthesis